MIKGAIFDADGTLFDSMFIWQTIGERYLSSIGYKPKENLNETIKNMSLYQAACYYISEYGVTLSVDEIMDGVNSMIKDYYFNDVKLKPYVADFLQDLDSKGIKMCIATATDKELVEAVLKKYDIRKHFSDIYTCSSVGHGKDEPIIYRKAAEHLKTEKSETFVFEDALYALETAKNDGFNTVAVFDKYEKQQSIVKEISDYFISGFSDIDNFWNFALQL